MTDRNLSSRLSLNCEPALFAPGSLTKNLNCACGVWPAALMAATPACAVASSLVLTTRTLYLRSGGGAFLLLLPADAAAGSVRARTARADPTTLHHLPCELRIRASLLPGASPDSPWVRHPRQRGPASSGSPASWPLQLRWVATEPNRPFVTLQAEVRGSDADLCRRAIQAAMKPLQKHKKGGAPRAAAPLRT